MEKIHGDAPVDMDALMEIMGDDRQLLQECLGDFVREFDVMMAAIRQAAGDQDGDALEKSAHALKGSLSYLAAKPASEAAFQLEKSGRDNDFVGLEAQLETLEQACEKLGVFIKGMMP